jgi:hypothetical protein
MLHIFSFFHNDYFLNQQSYLQTLLAYTFIVIPLDEDTAEAAEHEKPKG